MELERAVKAHVGDTIKRYECYLHLKRLPALASVAS